ncbi:MAG: alpha/beta fold hydrolase [Bacteroidota bacterium]
MKRVRLIGLPFAGGSQYSFSRFSKYLPDHIILHALDLPGRGTRSKEPLLDCMEALVEDVFLKIQHWINEPYAIFGHSLGSLLAFLLARRIQSKQLPLPLVLFLSGYEAPSVSSSAQRHLLPKDDFMKSLQALGRMDEVFENKLLFNFYEPIFRADITATETYQYEATALLNIPLQILKGREEAFSREEAMAWQKESIYDIQLAEYEGGHFFILQHERAIMELVVQQITFHLEKGGAHFPSTLLLPK